MMTLTEVTDQIELTVVDSSNAVLLAATIQSQVKQYLKEVATIYPYRIKEERFTTEDSRDIDVSGVVNLIDVPEVEYKVDQYPKKMRNVTRWGDNITLKITAVPGDAESVYLYCEKIHTLVDPPSSLVGAVNNASDYSAGDTSIILDGLGTGTIKADTLVVFTDIAGEYRVTADATITANAATIVITPGLLEDMDDDTVVTFRCSTLSDPRLEPAFIQYSAAKLELDWCGEIKNQVVAAKTAILLINSSVDSVSARLTQMVTDAGNMRTGASANYSDAVTAMGSAISEGEEADTALTKLSGDIELTNGLGADAGKATGLIDDFATALALADGYAVAGYTLINDNATVIQQTITDLINEIDQAITDGDSARALTNLVPIWGAPDQSKISAGSLQLGIVRGKLEQLQANIAEGSIYNESITNQLRTADGLIKEAQARMAAEAQLTQESALEVRERMRTAYGYIAAARGLLQADMNKVSGLARTVSSEAQVVNGYLAQSRGYYNESMADLSVARTIKSYETTALNKLTLARAELRKLVPPKTSKRYSED